MSDDRPTPAPEPDEPTEAPRPGVHDRWWWTGTFRAVLGAAVVIYQWPVISSGEAQVPNWILVAAGAGVVVWGVTILLRAWRDKEAQPR